MKITTETDIRNFEFWSGAKDRVKDIRYDDWDSIEAAVEEMFPDGCTDTELNDLFWFDFNLIAQACGYENEEHYFYGAAKDESDMIDVLTERFPEVSEEAIEEWVEWEWVKTDNLDRCCEFFEVWYKEWQAENAD